MIGANAEAIATAEDRERFKLAMVEIGLAVPASGIAHTLDEARAVAAEVGLPVIIRPAYILGGRGHRHRLDPDELRADRRDRPGRQPDPRDADRVVDRGLEGVRARGHAGPGRQLRGRSARSRTSTRWASTPATRSPSRRPRRSPTSSTSACGTPPSPASVGSASRPAARTCSSRWTRPTATRSSSR